MTLLEIMRHLKADGWTLEVRRNFYNNFDTQFIGALDDLKSSMEEYAEWIEYC